MKDTIKINNEIFQLVKVQRDSQSAVYYTNGKYLRLGLKKRILRDLILHRKMELAGFPVTPIIDEGELENQYYFIEKALGENHLARLFTEDTKLHGSIKNNLFEQFLKVVRRFTIAQLTTSTDEKNFDEFLKGIHLAELCDELPKYTDRIQNKFKEISRRLEVFPFVITHGDFNPHNIFPDGVIDLEDSFLGPAGYDLVTALVHIDSFPDSPEYELSADYHFTFAQKQKYFEIVDKIFLEHNLPSISKFKDDFEFCRAVWLAIRMHKTPKLQKFRYDLLIKKFLC